MSSTITPPPELVQQWYEASMLEGQVTLTKQQLTTMENHFEGQDEQALLDKAHVLHDAISDMVNDPAAPESCALSWQTAKLIASLELRVAELEKWVKALTAKNKRLRVGLNDLS